MYTIYTMYIGKIRHYGLCDETAFGTTHFMTSAHYLKLPKPIVIQNAYNLLERNEYELGLLEVCQPTTCNIGLMAKSPLAGGALTGIRMYMYYAVTHSV